MSRATRVAGFAAFASTLYLLLLFSVLPAPFLDAAVAEQILPVIPWWLLVSFGSYSLYSLGWGLFTFRDCPDAYTELLSEITQAKNELRSKGISVD